MPDFKTRKILLVRGDPLVALYPPHTAQDLVADVLKSIGCDKGDWIAVPAQELTVFAEMGSETRMVIFLGMNAHAHAQDLAKRVRTGFPKVALFVFVSESDAEGRRLAMEITGSQIYFIETTRNHHYNLGGPIQKALES